MTNSENRINNLLAELGFSENQRSVYLTLIASGPQTRTNLQKHARLLSASEIDQSLAYLSALHLVTEQHTKTNVRLAATQPGIAWRWQLMDLVWRHSNGDPGDSVQAIPPLENPRLERKRRAYLELIAAFEISGKKAVNSVTALRRGRAFLLDADYAYACAEAISTTKSQIFACERPPRLPHLPLFWAALTERLEAKIPYTRCVPLDELLHHGIRIVRRDTQTLGINLHVTASTNITRSFYLIDDLCVLAKNEAWVRDTSNQYGMLSFRPQVIERFRHDIGFKIMSQAIPAPKVIAMLESWVEQCSKLAHNEAGHDGQQVYENIAGLGRFTVLEPNHIEVASRLLSCNLLVRHQDGALTLSPPTAGPLASLT